MRVIFSAFILLVLSACGGGTGSAPSERPAGAIEGTVFNSPVSGATVRAYAFSGGVKGALLGESLTNSNGAFSITLSAPNELVLLESGGGVYREEASGRDVTVLPDISMRTVVQFTSGTRTGSSITFFTTLATALGEQLIGSGVPVANAVDQAFATFTSALGLDVRGTQPLDITNVANASPTVSAGHEYGFFGAAISQWTADAGVTNGTAAHALHTSISFLKLAQDDIRADGKLDGKAGATVLKVGTIAIDANVYRNKLAVAMLKIAQSSANKTGLTAAQLVPAALRWNESTSAIFGGAPVVPISTAGPTMSGLSPAAGASVSGTFGASVSATDTLGLVEVQFFVDSTLVGTAQDLTSPSVSINSRSFSDGSHTLRASARNIVGGTAAIEHSLMFDNTPPVITNVIPINGAVVKNIFFASAAVADNVGVASADFILDGYSLGNTGSVTVPAKAINTNGYPDGPHTLVVRATDSAGNASTVSQTVIFANSSR